MAVIAVADRVRELERFGADRFCSEYEAALESVLMALFSACPDAGDAWEEVADGFDAAVGRDRVVAFCLERGFDVRRTPGGPDDQLVGCWRDIGIMLLARDRGLIS